MKVRGGETTSGKDVSRLMEFMKTGDASSGDRLAVTIFECNLVRCKVVFKGKSEAVLFSAALNGQTAG